MYKSDFVIAIRRLSSSLTEIALSDLHYYNDAQMNAIVSSLNNAEFHLEHVIDLMIAEECEHEAF